MENVIKMVHVKNVKLDFMEIHVTKIVHQIVKIAVGKKPVIVMVVKIKNMEIHVY